MNRKKIAVMLNFNIRPCLKRMTSSEQGELFNAILNYAEHGIEHKFSNLGLYFVWDFIKPGLDNDKSYKFEETNQAERTTSKYKEWRKLVFERDNYTCKICGKHGGALNAHHILEWAKYPEERLNVDNGITLCQKCHRIVHKKRK